MQVYLPALVMVCLGAGFGVALAILNGIVGPRRRQVNGDPYESGMPSDGHIGQRFGISFYLVAILFLIFDVEVLLLYPTSVVLGELGWHALGAIGIFVFLLGIAFVYEWRRGSLNWK